MKYFTADRGQKRKDTGIFISKGLLFHETRFATAVDDAIDLYQEGLIT
jgi:hypothetical protein